MGYLMNEGKKESSPKCGFMSPIWWFGDRLKKRRYPHPTNVPETSRGKDKTASWTPTTTESRSRMITIEGKYCCNALIRRRSQTMRGKKRSKGWNGETLKLVLLDPKKISRSMLSCFRAKRRAVEMPENPHHPTLKLGRDQHDRRSESMKRRRKRRESEREIKRGKQIVFVEGDHVKEDREPVRKDARKHVDDEDETKELERSPNRLQDSADQQQDEEVGEQLRCLLKAQVRENLFACGGFEERERAGGGGGERTERKEASTKEAVKMLKSRKGGPKVLWDD